MGNFRRQLSGPTSRLQLKPRSSVGLYNTFRRKPQILSQENYAHECESTAWE